MIGLYRRLAIVGLLVSLLVIAGCAKGGGDKSCNSNADCSGSEQCVDGSCTKQSEQSCVSNSNCAKHEFCDSNICKPRSCVESVQCGDPALVCVEPGVCAPKDPNSCDCKSTSACTATDPICQGQSCDCLPTSSCTASDPKCQTQCDCLPTSVCTATDPKCQPSCDCLPTSSCTATDPTCQPVCDCLPTSSCTATAANCQPCDCLPGSTCTATDPKCNQECDCNPSSGCTETDATCTGSCNNDTDCPRNSEYCNTQLGACQKGCKNNTVCPGAETCNMTTHTCSGSGVGCTINSECSNNKVCSPIVDPNDSTKLTLTCKDPVAIGAQGEACADNSECRTGACGANGICYIACSKHTDCGQSGWVCVDTTITVSGITLPVKSCKSQPVAGDCGTDSDCTGADQGKICTLTVNADSSALIATCRDAIGTIVGGDPCANDADCQSGVCLNTAVCFKPCTLNSQCTAVNQKCEEMTFVFGSEADPKEQLVKGCNTTRIACKNDSECSSNPNLTCTPSVANSGENFLSPQCLVKTGDKSAGDVCAADGDCKSGFCFTTAKICYGICDTDNDCTNNTKCYQNMITFTFDQDTDVKTDDKYDSTSACVPDQGSWTICTKDSNCLANEWCSPQPNKDSTQWEGRCTTRVGSLGPGADCTADSQCRSDFCIPPSQGVTPSASNPGICFGLCSSTVDCAGIFSSCQSVDLTTHDRGTEDDETDDLTASLKVCL